MGENRNVQQKHKTGSYTQQFKPSYDDSDADINKDEIEYFKQKVR